MSSASNSISERFFRIFTGVALVTCGLQGPALATEAPGPVTDEPASATATGSLAIAPLSWLPARDPWVAAGLSLGVNGLGQVYNGDWDKAWWAWAPLVAYPVAWGIDALAGSNVARTTTVVWWTGAKVWSSWDAFHSAEQPR